MPEIRDETADWDDAIYWAGSEYVQYIHHLSNSGGSADFACLSGRFASRGLTKLLHHPSHSYLTSLPANRKPNMKCNQHWMKSFKQEFVSMNDVTTCRYIIDDYIHVCYVWHCNYKSIYTLSTYLHTYMHTNPHGQATCLPPKSHIGNIL